MIKTTAFKCGGCSKISRWSDVIKEHEKTCPYVEENKACATCRNYERGPVPKCAEKYFASATAKNKIGLRLNCEKHTAL